MAITLKTPQQVALLRDAGRIVAETYEELRPHVVPGVTTAELDRLAEAAIRSRGALPMYKGHGALSDRRGRTVRPPFPATICVAVNDVICHGIPSARQELREGDIIGIDIGARYKGWIGDSCRTFAVGSVDKDSQRLMDVALRSLELGIEQARPGKHLGDIGAAIQTYAEAQGFSTVRELGGHGVGRELWEEPFVQHFGVAGTGVAIMPGMVFTIEPMINAGGPQIRQLPDHWAIATADGKRSAQYEHTLVITEDGCDLLTVL
ncbi:MAG TPA: type I methionyl aminopeptidase [Ktedonobacterales bacterium]|nr:type I methionyl aminopeptidase [Ktedonobacterales bacterium]